MAGPNRDLFKLEHTLVGLKRLANLIPSKFMLLGPEWKKQNHTNLLGQLGVHFAIILVIVQDGTAGWIETIALSASAFAIPLTICVLFYTEFHLMLGAPHYPSEYQLSFLNNMHRRLQNISIFLLCASTFSLLIWVSLTAAILLAISSCIAAICLFLGMAGLSYELTEETAPVGVTPLDVNEHSPPSL